MEWCTGRNTLAKFCSLTDCFSDYVDHRTVNGLAVLRRGDFFVYRGWIFGLTGNIYSRTFFLAYIADHVFIDGCIFIARLTIDFIDRAFLNADSGRKV